MTLMADALEHLVRGIVDHPDDVRVDLVTGRRGRILEVRVHPDDLGKVNYGVLFSALKTKHNATLFGVAESTLGDDLILNAPTDHRIDPGKILYFMAARRIKAVEIDWPALSAEQTEFERTEAT